MAKLAGRFCQLQYAGYDLTGRSNQFEAPMELDSIDGTAFDSAFDEDIGYLGLWKSGVTFTCFLDGSAGQSYTALKDRLGSFANQHFSILVGQNAPVAVGDPAFGITVKEFKFTPSAQVKGAVVAQGVASGQEKPDWACIVLMNATITNTTTGTTVDQLAATSAGGTGYLQVMSALTTDRYVVKVQHSTNGSDWVDLITFAANASAVLSERLTAAGAVYQYIRAIATRTGAAGDSFKLSVIFQRN